MVFNQSSCRTTGLIFSDLKKKLGPKPTKIMYGYGPTARQLRKTDYNSDYNLNNLQDLEKKPRFCHCKLIFGNVVLALKNERNQL